MLEAGTILGLCHRELQKDDVHVTIPTPKCFNVRLKGQAHMSTVPRKLSGRVDRTAVYSRPKTAYTSSSIRSTAPTSALTWSGLRCMMPICLRHTLGQALLEHHARPLDDPEHDCMSAYLWLEDAAFTGLKGAVRMQTKVTAPICHDGCRPDTDECMQIVVYIWAS